MKSIKTTTLNNKVILLLSGGIDSTTLLAWLSKRKKNIFAISFDYGQKHIIELEFAKRNATKYNVLEHHVCKIDNNLFSKSNGITNSDVSFSAIDDNISAVVPARNMLFLSNAFSFAETINCYKIYFAVNSDDSTTFQDCTNQFVKKLNSLLKIQSTLENPPQVIAPFINFSKKEVVQLAKKMNVVLEETISCYEPDGVIECGKCLSCKLRNSAMN